MIRLFVILGLLAVAFCGGFWISDRLQKDNAQLPQEKSEQVIAYEIRKLNKMLVVEQDYAEIFSYNQSDQKMYGLLSFDKTISLMVKSSVQVLYDLSAMKTSIDPVQKRIIIKEIPESEIKVFSDADVLNMNQSIMNHFNKNDLNEIKQRAIQSLLKKIDTIRLKNEGQLKLKDNLKDLYAIAQIYQWEIVDQTRKLDMKATNVESQ